MTTPTPTAEVLALAQASGATPLNLGDLTALARALWDEAAPAARGATPTTLSLPANAPTTAPAPAAATSQPAASAPAPIGAPAVPPRPAGAANYYFLQDSATVPASPAPVAPRARADALPPVADITQDLVRLIDALEPAPRAEPVAGAAPSAFYFVEERAAPRTHDVTARSFDPGRIRRDFPILAETVNGRPLAWLDNAATTHKPQAVIDRLVHFYAHENSNIHRGAHTLAARATDAFEYGRKRVAEWLGAGSADDIVFTRGATEAINLVAQAWGRQHVGRGDEIVVSALDHHANIVPWQQLAAATGAQLRVIPVDDHGDLLLDEYAKLLNARTRIVAITQVANAIGTVVPVADVIALAHRQGARVLVDGAQSVAHFAVDVRALDADFFVFSGHKLYAPTGIGALYGKPEVLAHMAPWQGGGNMIADVTFERTEFQPAPARFEAGTAHIAGAAGLGAAIDYLASIGIERIARHEHALMEQAVAALRGIPGVRMIGEPRERAGALSFVLDGYAPEEVGKALDAEGIAVRSGHHCAQPILRRLGVEASVRPSFGLYNTGEEIERLASVVRQLSLARGRRG